MAMTIRCRCGKVRGDIDPARAYTRATCYCKDCQAFARWLGIGGITDDRGGTDIVPMAPAAVRFGDGLEHVACMSLGPRGLLRWYATCCRTPLANTPRDPKLPYVGMVTACFDAAPAVLDASLGPRDRIVLNARSAAGPVKSTPLAFFAGGLRIFANIAVAKLRGERGSPFFDGLTGAPIREPQLLSLQERQSLA